MSGFTPTFRILKENGSGSILLASNNGSFVIMQKGNGDPGSFLQAMKATAAVGRVSVQFQQNSGFYP